MVPTKSVTVLCKQCSESITSNYVKCLNCNNSFHFNPCCTLSESTYNGMNGERKATWKCHICKPRNKSANNNTGDNANTDDKFTQKQLKENEDEEKENRKRLKDPFSSNELQFISTLKSEVKSEVNELRIDINDVKKNIKELKETVEKLSINVNQTESSFKEEIKTSLSYITSTLSSIVAQISEIKAENTQIKKEMTEMDTTLNKLQQQLVSKKIEIKNVCNNEIQLNNIVKTIAASVNVQILDQDINDAYRLKSIKDKIIVEFTTHNKKERL